MKREVKRKKTKRQKQNNVIIVVVVVMIIARQIVERKFETTKARMVQRGSGWGWEPERGQGVQVNTSLSLLRNPPMMSLSLSLPPSCYLTLHSVTSNPSNYGP